MVSEDNDALMLWLNTAKVAEPIVTLADLHDGSTLCKAALLLDPGGQGHAVLDSDESRRRFVCSFLEERYAADLQSLPDLMMMLTRGSDDDLAQILHLLLLTAVRDLSPGRQFFVDAALSLPSTVQSRIFALLHNHTNQPNGAGAGDHSVASSDTALQHEMVHQHGTPPPKGVVVHRCLALSPVLASGLQGTENDTAISSPLAASSPLERYLSSPALIAGRKKVVVMQPLGPAQQRQQNAVLRQCAEDLERERELREEAEAELRTVSARLKAAEARLVQTEEDHGQEMTAMHREHHNLRQQLVERERELALLRRADGCTSGNCEAAASLRKESAALMTQLTELQASSKDAEALLKQHCQLSALCDQQQEHMRLLTEEAARLHAEAAAGTREREALREQLTTVRDECQELRTAAACWQRRVPDQPSQAEPSVAMEMRLLDVETLLLNAQHALAEKTEIADKLLEEVNALTLQRDELAGERYHLISQLDDVAARHSGLKVEHGKVVAEQLQLYAKRDHMAAKCKQLEAEQQKAFADKNRFAEQCTRLTAEKDALACQCSNLSHQCELLTEDVRRASQQRDCAENEREQLAASRDQLSAEVIRLAADRDLLLAEFRQLEEELQQCQAEQASLVATHKLLLEKHEQATADHLAVLSERADLVNECKRRGAECNELAKFKDELAEERARLQEELKQAAAESAGTAQERNELETSNYMALDQIKSLTAKLADAAKERDSVRAEFQTLTGEHEKLQSASKRTSGALEKLTGEQSRLVTDFHRLVVERNELRTKCEQLEAKNTRELAALAAESRQVADEREALAARHKELENDHGRLDAQHRSLKEECQRLSDAYSCLAAENGKVLANLKSLEERCIGLMADRDRCLVEKEELASDRLRLESAHNHVLLRQASLLEASALLTSERDALVCERRQLTTARDQLVAERDSLAATNHRLAQDYDSIVAERDLAVADCKRRQEEHGLLLVEHGRCAVKLDRLESERLQAANECAKLSGEQRQLIVERDQLAQLLADAAIEKTQAVEEGERKLSEVLKQLDAVKYAAKGEREQLQKALAEACSARAADQQTVQQLKESLDMITKIRDNYRESESKLEARCRELDLSKRTMEDECEALQVAVTKAHSSLADKEQTIQRMNDALESHKKTLESYRLHYDQKKQAVVELTEELERQKHKAKELEAAQLQKPHHLPVNSALAIEQGAEEAIVRRDLASRGSKEVEQRGRQRAVPSAAKDVTSRSTHSVRVPFQGQDTTLRSGEDLQPSATFGVSSHSACKRSRPLSAASAGSSPDQAVILPAAPDEFAALRTSDAAASAYIENDGSRVQELRRRNTLCPPHMRSVYALELQQPIVTLEYPQTRMVTPRSASAAARPSSTAENTDTPASLVQRKRATAEDAALLLDLASSPSAPKIRCKAASTASQPEANDARSRSSSTKQPARRRETFVTDHGSAITQTENPENAGSQHQVAQKTHDAFVIPLTPKQVRPKRQPLSSNLR